MLRWSTSRAVLLTAMVLVTPYAVAQDGAPDEGGQETGHGDVFGDLVHILRSPETGQAILQQREVEVEGEEGVTEWGYCPIPLDAAGAEIPFAPLSCEIDPAEQSRLVEVDYFGRLSAGRTKERNLRMHFDEVISTILDAEVVDLDPAGRIKMGTGCTGTECTEWKVIDSPLENMGFYHRLMKYGHIQTDPMEEDTSFHGDPALGTVYHPALRQEDWAKFGEGLRNLLPQGSSDACFSGGFNDACAQPQALDAEDFIRAASFLGGAADKHGRMSPDLVQYFHRVLRITEATPESAASVNTLPALVRLADQTTIVSATTLPDYDQLPFPVNELFVDYSAARYHRNAEFTRSVPALVASGIGTWAENPALPLLPFLEYVFGTQEAEAENIDAYVRNAGDAQRAIEFIHNYEIPENLYTVYAASTVTTVASLTVPASPTDQPLTLTATVASTAPVNAGTVSFSVQTSAGAPVGLAVSGAVANGIASAGYVLPGGTPAQTLQIVGSYSGAFGFAASSGTGALTIDACAVVLTPSSDDFTAAEATGEFTVTIGADCSWLAASSADWVTITSPAAGTGSAPIGFAVAANTSSIARTAQITVGSAAFTVNQAGVVCEYTVTPAADFVDAPGGTRTLNVVPSAADCAGSWNVSDDADWLTESIATGTGAQSFTYTAAPNTTASQRVGVISVAGVDVTITQRPAGAKPFLDLNGDGIGDAVLYDTVTGQFKMFTGTPGAFSELTAGTWAKDWTVLKARFNHDAFDDLLLYNKVNGLWFKALNLGNGGFSFYGYRWAPGWTPVVGDWNGDGASDVFLYNKTNGTWFRAMTVAAGADFVYIPGTWAPGWNLFTGDFDRSGTDDIFLYNSNASTDPNSGRWFRVMTLPDGSLTYVAGDLRWANNWQLTVGDWDGDGRDDLFLYRSAGQWFRVFFTAASALYVGGTWDPGLQVFAAQFTRDSRDDLLRYNPVNGETYTVISEAGGTMTEYFTPWIPGVVLNISDFTADGISDVLIYNPADGTVYQANTITPGTWSHDPCDAWPTSMTTVVAN